MIDNFGTEYFIDHLLLIMARSNIIKGNNNRQITFKQ